jgi:hypothetical protein
MPKVFESKAFRAVATSGSIKTTVPESVATVLGLEPGDSIVWEVDVDARSVVVKRGTEARLLRARRGRRVPVGESA